MAANPRITQIIAEPIFAEFGNSIRVTQIIIEPIFAGALSGASQPPIMPGNSGNTPSRGHRNDGPHGNDNGKEDATGQGGNTRDMVFSTELFYPRSVQNIIHAPNSFIPAAGPAGPSGLGVFFWANT